MEFDKKRTGVEEKFFNVCREVTIENGYELYDFEYIPGSTTVRLFIMDPETNSAVIEDCVKVDRALTPYFEEDWVPDDVVLEVSSPGVYRSLKTREHFEKAKGEFILLTVTKALLQDEIESLPKKLNKRKKFRGKLVDIIYNILKIDLDGLVLDIDIEQVKKASLDPDL